MKRVWLILNRSSRSVAGDWDAILTAAFEARGTTVAGLTDFPDQPLPTAAELDAGKVDVVAVAAGDGTINAVARAYDDWGGVLLVLPGGTMNLLAKSLHGDAAPEAIVAAIADPPDVRPIATVDAGDHRAVVGAIVGPAASWVHTREAVRKGAWSKIARNIRLAYTRTLSKSVHLRAGQGRSRGYRAVFIHPADDTLSIVKVRASGWQDGVRLGFTYLTGTWEGARGVETDTKTEVVLAEREPVSALFDGEPLKLPGRSTLTLGKTRLRFVHTI